MSRPVDVLEVIRKSANAARMSARKHGGHVLTQFAEDSVEARAAVAELIEASSAYLAGEYLDDEVESRVNYQARRRRERDRFATALARARGEA